MLFNNKLFNSIACLLSFTNLQLVIPGRTWILLYLGRTVYKRLWACLALYLRVARLPTPGHEELHIKIYVTQQFPNNSWAALHFQFEKTVQQNTLTNPIQENLKLIEDAASLNQYFFLFHEVASPTCRRSEIFYPPQISSILINYCNSGSNKSRNPGKNSVPQLWIKPKCLTIKASVTTTRPPRTLISVTFTPPRRKHVLLDNESYYYQPMKFEEGNVVTSICLSTGRRGGIPGLMSFLGVGMPGPRSLLGVDMSWEWVLIPKTWTRGGYPPLGTDT